MSSKKLMLSGVVILGLLIGALPASAQGDELVNRSSRWGVAHGVSIFGGAPGTEPVQIVSGYDSGTTYTSTRGGAIEATPEAIVLKRDGIYQIHLEGVLFFDADDTTAADDAASDFTLLVNGDPWVGCITTANANTARLPELAQPTPDHERAAACTVNFTLEVKHDGSDPSAFPVAFPRYTTVQAALIPNGPLGDATLYVVRFEVTRIGP